jgi:hypothetical protein
LENTLPKDPFRAFLIVLIPVFQVFTIQFAIGCTTDLTAHSKAVHVATIGLRGIFNAL